MIIDNCPKCGGTHIGSYDCPITNPAKAVPWPSTAPPPPPEDENRRLREAPMTLDLTPEEARALRALVEVYLDTDGPAYECMPDWTPPHDPAVLTQLRVKILEAKIAGLIESAKQ